MKSMYKSSSQYRRSIDSKMAAANREWRRLQEDLTYLNSKDAPQAEIDEVHKKIAAIEDILFDLEVIAR